VTVVGLALVFVLAEVSLDALALFFVVFTDGLIFLGDRLLFSFVLHRNIYGQFICARLPGHLGSGLVTRGLLVLLVLPGELLEVVLGHFEFLINQFGSFTLVANL